MQNLSVLIEKLEKSGKLHISILDLGGILNLPTTEIDFNNVIHSKEFCRIAKSTDAGYRVCLRCKMLANTKASREKKAFCGCCTYGLCEVAMPVIIDKSLMAVIYIGNAVIDEAATKARIEKTCSLTGVDCERLMAQLKNCEYTTGYEELYQTAEILCDYLKMLYENTPKTKRKLHWLVSLMIGHAKKSFCDNITLKELAATYQKNEKYLGRLFKKEIGISFNEYCMELRLKKADEMLLKSKERIIDIAFACGFNNISYFNRTFYKRHGVSPSEYRKSS
ncbi:MAG: helix-turn-helix domain-containing protein [Clostridia bacterium]|nr:helix-turn-helix domain-containing protein [Clostridia bacterium]